MSELLLSIPEAAAELGVSPSCVAKWIDDQDNPLRAINQGKGEKRRRLSVTSSSVAECEKYLEKREKDRASRRPKYKRVSPVEACLPAAQVEMFSGAGTVDLLEKLLAEQKKTNVALADLILLIGAAAPKATPEKQCHDLPPMPGRYRT